MVEKHDHEWWWSKWDERFHCDFTDEDGFECKAVLSMESVLKLIPVTDKGLLVAWEVAELHNG